MLSGCLLSSAASRRGQSSFIRGSPIWNVSFFPLDAFFCNFLFTFCLQQFDSMGLGVLLSVVIMLQVYWDFWICRFTFSPNLGIGDPGIFLQYLFCLLSLLPVLWLSHYSFVRWLDMVLQVTETSFTKFSIFLLSPLAANSNISVSVSIDCFFFWIMRHRSFFFACLRKSSYFFRHWDIVVDIV